MPTLTELLDQEIKKGKKKGINIWYGQKRENRSQDNNQPVKKNRNKPKAQPQPPQQKIIKTNKQIANALPKFLNSFYEHYKSWLKNNKYYLSTQTTQDNVIILFPNKKTTMEFKKLFEINLFKWINDIFCVVWEVLDFEFTTDEKNKDIYSPYNPIRMHGHFTFCNKDFVLVVLENLDQYLFDKQNLKDFYLENLKMFKMLYLRINEKAGKSLEYFIKPDHIKFNFQTFINCFDQWELNKVKEYINKANEKLFKEFAKLKRASTRKNII